MGLATLIAKVPVILLEPKKRAEIWCRVRELIREHAFAGVQIILD